MRLPKAPRAAVSNSKAETCPSQAIQKGTPAQTAQEQEIKDDDKCDIISVFTTISEQGQQDLEKAAQAGMGVQAITGADAKVSGQKWVCQEGEQSKALFQRYTDKASPEERRMSQTELLRRRHSIGEAVQKQTDPADAAVVSSKEPPVADDGSDRYSDAVFSETSGRPSQSDAAGQGRERHWSSFDNLVREIEDLHKVDRPVRPDDAAAGVDSTMSAVFSSDSNNEDEGGGSTSGIQMFGQCDSEERSDEWKKWRQRKEERKERMANKRQKQAENLKSPRPTRKDSGSRSGRFSKRLLDPSEYASSGSQRSFTSSHSSYSRYSLDTGIFQLSHNYSQRSASHTSQDAQQPQLLKSSDGNNEEPKAAAVSTQQQWEVPQESCRRSWGARSDG
jgi:hypothetical protein